MDTQARLDATARNDALEAAWLALVPREEEAAAAHDAFRAAAEEQAAALTSLRARDEALDRGFRDRLKAACGAVDSDVLKTAAALFRKRRVAAVAGSGAGGEEEEHPLTRADLPDGFGAIADDAVMWPALAALRQEKLASEAAVRAAAATQEAMRDRLQHLDAAYEGFKGRLDALAAEREALASAQEVATNDVPLLLRLRMGQDEVAGAAVGAVDDYADALLVRRTWRSGLRGEWC